MLALVLLKSVSISRSLAYADRLHSIQMIHTRALQLVGTDPGGINRLSDKTVYVKENSASVISMSTPPRILIASATAFQLKVA